MGRIGVLLDNLGWEQGLTQIRIKLDWTRLILEVARENKRQRLKNSKPFLKKPVNEVIQFGNLGPNILQTNIYQYFHQHLVSIWTPQGNED